MGNFKKINILQRTVHCNAWVVLRKTIFSCAYLLCGFEEKIEVQTIEMYKEHTKF